MLMCALLTACFPRRKTPLRVVLRGFQEAAFNGVYEKAGEVKGRPAYQQVGDPDLWICYGGKDWMVQETTDKGTSRGFAYTMGGRRSALARLHGGVL